jgi:tetratricopeptide (TPR) repeat protein
MSTLSNKYYLQAFEAYPYDLTEALESLSYALSYESSHAGAHCLLGRLNMEQLMNYEKAEYHFEQALISDINYIATYEHYSMLLIILKDYKKAEKLIQHAYTIKGANVPIMHHREGLLNEFRKNMVKARRFMKLAYENSCNEEERSFLKNELDRVKSKLNTSKKKKKKKKSTKK